MQPQAIRELLLSYRDGKQTLEEVERALTALPFEDLGDLKVDHHRELRTGIPETIFGQGKRPEQILRAAERLQAAGSMVLATRLAPEAAALLRARWPEGRWHEASRIFHLPSGTQAKSGATALVLSAGTSDLPVAEEAAVTAAALGARVESIHDVGVAGLHRLLAQRGRLAEADVIIVVAGMEGALASVTAGLVRAVVIAVPTSVGYGASFGGLAALLAMLNSCGSGVLVCNIDNGYGAGIAAARICRLGNRE